MVRFSSCLFFTWSLVCISFSVLTFYFVSTQNQKSTITTLISFFTANLQTSNPHLQPPPDELAEMTARAVEVVRLLEALRHDTPIFASSLLSSTPGSNTLVSMHPQSLDIVKSVGSTSLGMAIMDVDAPDRAPKRPWEDVEGMLPPGSTGAGQAGSSAPQPSAQGNTEDRSMAEADMELIRSKRAITTMAAAAALGSGGGGTGGGKNKYRKRSVSFFYRGDVIRY